jgi:D-alanine-D-alanine ligase
MKIAVVYNRESNKVINLFGIPNRERYGLKAVKRIVDALKKGGHQVMALEGDKDIIERLEEFMPQALKGERPGMVFNISYGIQGQARYTHVPSILEMVGIPYVGSGPLAHSLSLDKVVAKMMFVQEGLPTPEFAVLDGPPLPGFPAIDLKFPLIVKPKNEAVSLGLKIVRNEKELREAANNIFEAFHQPVLVEQYIDGREINVGLLGNDPPELFAPAEIVFGKAGPRIYTNEDKVRTSGREIGVKCPADINPEIVARAQELAFKAFRTLGCFDCARVDMRLDKKGNLYILEINSLPSLGEHGSYVAAAQHMGLDFTALVNRLVDVASARYFGTPGPPQLAIGPEDHAAKVFTFLTSRRDRIERSVHEWAARSSRTDDPVGMQAARRRLGAVMGEAGLKASAEFHEKPHVLAWESPAGFEGGTLLIAHLDVPLRMSEPRVPFRKDPEWLYGEGVGTSRGPLVMIEYTLKALRAARRLRNTRLGVLFCTDHGLDHRYSSEIIRQAAALAREVLVLRPGNPGSRIVIQRRGQRKYHIAAEGKHLRPGHSSKGKEAMSWVLEKLDKVMRLSSKKERLAISPIGIHTESAPMLLPYFVTVSLLVTYLDQKVADAVDEKIRKILEDGDISSTLALYSEIPPMRERRMNARLVKTLKETATKWEIPLDTESSLWPSVAGLVPSRTPVVCGMGPVARDLNTFNESVNRKSLIERALLLAEFLLSSSHG